MLSKHSCFTKMVGFTIFGRLEGPAPIFPRFFLKKDLGNLG